MTQGARPQEWDHPTTDLGGKAVLVAGGTTGIGRAAAGLLAAQGARVLVFGRSEDKVQETVAEITGQGGAAWGVAADQSRQEDLERVFAEVKDKLQGLDILVNCAAVEKGGVEEASLEDILYTIQTNIFGYAGTCHLALQLMQEGRGHIVNIGSMSADAREESSEVYVATKAAIQGFSGSLRKAANKKGIRVTLIEPGLIDTELGEMTPEQRQEKLADQSLIPPEDIAECIYYALTQPQRCDVVEVRIRPVKQII